MFKSQQYRARATERGELLKGSTSAEESRKFKTWRDGFGRGFVADCDDPVHIAEQDRRRGAAPAADDEHVLRCLGVALIMKWMALPTTLQRELFDTAGSVGMLVETAALRGRIARFLHKHIEAGRGTPSDAKWCAAALSRWDNEGGAVRDGLTM
ncbi:hypothetical protein ACFFWD_40145 [Bradyrhizobium erythrophlei]|uniref:hypothetical protein n=1 Tax=Bradyrhizobium erythrophlei TaxID=1437360 RepID=UPI0035EAEDF1